MKTPIVHINTIHELQRMVGLESMQHPSFAIIRLEDVPPLPVGYPQQMSYGFYSIGLKRDLNGYIRYGRRGYDFQEGAMGFTAPNQVFGFESNVAEGATGWLLFFHSEFLSKHQLAQNIEQYGFFDYQVNEGLHLSKQEEALMESVMENLLNEYQKPIDKYSKAILLSNLELLLTYADRFYGRQFITRNEVDSIFLDKFNKELRRYFNEENLLEKRLPTVGYLAQHMNVSSNYLCDLLRELTGKTTLEHIHFFLIDKAKSYLVSTEWSIAEVAYELGFEYPSYFTRLFKDKTGNTPKQYRTINS